SRFNPVNPVLFRTLPRFHIPEASPGPPNAVDIDCNEIMAAWARRTVVIGVRIDPHSGGNVKIDSDAMRQNGVWHAMEIIERPAFVRPAIATGRWRPATSGAKTKYTSSVFWKRAPDHGLASRRILPVRRRISGERRSAFRQRHDGAAFSEPVCQAAG